MLRTAAVTQERADIWVDFSRHPSSKVCRLLASVVNAHGIAGLHLEVLELVQQAIEELRSARCLADDHNCLPVAVAGVSHAIVEPSSHQIHGSSLDVVQRCVRPPEIQEEFLGILRANLEESRHPPLVRLDVEGVPDHRKLPPITG